MLGPVLLIGCGGSGGKTLRVARASLEQRLRRAGFPPGFIPDAFQFIHVDVPPKQEGSITEYGDYLPGEDYVNLVDAGIEYRAVDDALVARCEQHSAMGELVGWRPDPRAVRVAIQEGAGQYRALGRLITLRRMANVYKEIERAANLFDTADARSQLDAVSEALGHPVPAASAERPTPLAVVVSSLAGGTGAGCFLDVCDVLRKAFTWGDHALGVLYAPDVFAGVAGTEGVQSNAIAALGELMAGYWSGEEWPTELLKINGVRDQSHTQGGVAHPFIIGTKNAGGVSLSSPQQVFRAVGEALGMIAAESEVREEVVNFLTVNWQKNAARNDDDLGFSPPNTMAALSSFGYARAGLGRERFGDYAVKRLVRDAAEFMNSGYMAHAQTMFQGEELTPDEALDRLAKHLSVRYLDDCGLNERDRNDQVLDALRPAELTDRWRSLRHEVTGQVARAEPAPPTTWARRISEALEPQGRPFEVETTALLQRTVGEWTSTVPDHVLEVTADYAARYGAPVARKLVETAIAEMRAVADQLVAEAASAEHEASQWSSRVSGALPPGSKQITGENPQIEAAVREGASRYWKWAEAQLRLRAKEVMLELGEGFLTPSPAGVEGRAERPGRGPPARRRRRAARDPRLAAGRHRAHLGAPVGHRVPARVGRVLPGHLP